MAAAKNKTMATTASVADYIAALPDERRRTEAATMDGLMRRVTGHEPQMWGPSIIGYGSYSYTYDSGRSGVSCRAGFSPRKAAITLYAMGESLGDSDDVHALLDRLGKHERGKGCLYIKRLDSIDLTVLEQLLELSWRAMNDRYPQ